MAATDAFLSIRSAQIITLAETISSLYVQLQNLLSAKTDQSAVLETQLPILISTLNQYKDTIKDVPTLFARDQAVNLVFTTIKATIDLLSADPDYTTFQTTLNNLKTAIDQYFVFTLTNPVG